MIIENYLLEYLVAFAKTGTIAGVAEELNVTQPTVSRGLRKLEALLDVKLFDRQPQKITLTAVGKFAAQRASTLLNQHRDFASAVHHFASKNRYLRVGATIPGPILLLRELYKDEEDDQLIFDRDLLEQNQITPALSNHKYSLLFSSKEIQTATIESRFVGTEKLAIKITKYNSLYHRQTVSFADLSGHEFVVAANTGEWQPIIEKNILHAQFLYQPEPGSMQELIKYSNFPIFKTNLTHYLEQLTTEDDRKRKYIPITDDAAQLNIYAAYLKDDWPNISKIVKRVTTAWDKILRFKGKK